MKHRPGLVFCCIVICLPLLGQTTGTHKAHSSSKAVHNSLKESAPFDFHGDALGETLATFKQKHSDVAADCVVIKTDLVKCSLSDPKPTVVGVPTNDVEFKFFEDKLFLINVFIIRVNAGLFDGQPVYRLLTDAYTAKYGTPDKNEQETYQNGFGAVTYGQTVTWLDMNRAYSLYVEKSPTDDNRFNFVISFGDLASEHKQMPAPKSGDL